MHRLWPPNSYFPEMPLSWDFELKHFLYIGLILMFLCAVPNHPWNKTAGSSGGRCEADRAFDQINGRAISEYNWAHNGRVRSKTGVVVVLQGMFVGPKRFLSRQFLWKHRGFEITPVDVKCKRFLTGIWFERIIAWIKTSKNDYNQ